jgi:DNA-binding NtrC family response regulator
MEKPPVVAIINTTPDVIEMLRIAFESAGIATITAFTHDIRQGRVDVEAFMRQHEPKVVVYDLAPPYPNNWLLFQHITSLPAMQHKTFILTTTNKAHVEKLASGAKLPIFEIVGTPYDLNELVEEVRQALRARPVR